MKKVRGTDDKLALTIKVQLKSTDPKNEIGSFTAVERKSVDASSLIQISADLKPHEQRRLFLCSFECPAEFVKSFDQMNVLVDVEPDAN